MAEDCFIVSEKIGPSIAALFDSTRACFFFDEQKIEATNCSFRLTFSFQMNLVDETSGVAVTQQAGLIPDEIILSRDRRNMRLVWSEGRDASIAASSLRDACRCAWCTRDRILDRFVVATSVVHLDQVEALGSHGLHIRFSDGHARGIFPWAYLEELAEHAPSATSVETSTPPL